MQTLYIKDWVIRYRMPEGDGPHPVVWLFHGWRGDEDSMWVFASLLPPHYLLLAPRAQYPEPDGGYSWYPIRHEGWPPVDAFSPAVHELLTLMENWSTTAPNADFERTRLAGFSQGAAMAYAFALLYPGRVQAVAALAGFLPQDSSAHLVDDTLDGKPIYISHGTNDHLVPVIKARSAVRQLRQAGAEVTYCESKVGHKLSADCFEDLEVFFNS